MTKNKPIISILMACLLLFGVFGWTVTAKAEIASGTCGTCNWVIDDEGTLTISPADGVSGTLDSLSFDNNWPWHSKRVDVKKVVIEDGVKAQSSIGGMFKNMVNCSEFHVSGLDMSQAQYAMSMFEGCKAFTDTSGFAGWNVSSITGMESMFKGCTSLVDLSGLENWDTSNVSTMVYMFQDCSSIADTSSFANWNTGNVKGMSQMFYGCTSLEDTSGLADWDTSKVTTMSYMFSGCASLADTSGLERWDTDKVTSMECTFSGCRSLTGISGLADWETGNVTNMGSMFSSCTSLADTSGLAGWDTSNVTNMNNMFYGCSSLTDSSDFAEWNTGNVTNMNYMFLGCTSLADTSGFADWDTGSVTNMGSMFSGCESLANSSGFADWDTSNVTKMDTMFYGCASLADTSGFTDWDTSNVTGMSCMFQSCTSLADTSGFADWETGSVTDMSSMFQNCTSLADTSGFADWDTGNVKNMIFMFQDCTSLADTSGFADWDTGNVTNMSYMFRRCTSLADTSGLVDWDTDNVKNMSSMFSGCSSLVEVTSLSNWNTSNVTNMANMFAYCYILKKLDMSGWDTSAVTSFGGIFAGSSKLKMVNIGENVKFDGDNISNNNNKLTLPSPPSSQDGISYTRKWIREDGSAGPFTPGELITNYSPEMAGWWIWEEVPVNYRLSYAAPDQAAGSMAPETVKANEGHTLPKCGYVLFANRFDHWVDGRGNSYPDQGTIPATRYSAGDQVTLTAVFVPIDTKVNVVDGAFEVSLRAGEKAKFDGIPAGTAYQVFEETPDGWLLVGQVNSSGQIEPLQEAQAAFVNRYQPDITSVQFSGSKTLDSRPAEEGSYTFQLLENGVVIQEKTILPGGFIQFDPITYERGDAGVHVYTIREKDSGNDAIEHDTHEETITVTVTDNGDGTLSSTASYDADGIVFANKLRPGTLKLGKTANGATDANSGDTFRFRITFQNENGQPLDNDIYWYVEEDGVPVDNMQGP